MLDGGGEYSPSKMKVKMKKKKKSKNKRRFSDEQIRSLETIFEFESKLEPRKKLQVARELGLQPRQVAIWFQNRRARWKSKQLERDYRILQVNYNALASQFETLKKEKQALTIQFQKLNDLMHNSPEENRCCRLAAAENSLSLERSELGIGVLSEDDHSSLKDEYFGLYEEVPELLLNMVEPPDSSLISTENWGSLVDGLLDQSGTSNQWWDYWS